MAETPGPWYVAEHTLVPPTIHQKGSGAQIADMREGWPDADIAANAKLIARAPEMQAVLEYVAKADTAKWPGYQHQTILYELASKARDVLGLPLA